MHGFYFVFTNKLKDYVARRKNMSLKLRKQVNYTNNHQLLSCRKSPQHLHAWNETRRNRTYIKLQLNRKYNYYDYLLFESSSLYCLSSISSVVVRKIGIARRLREGGGRSTLCTCDGGRMVFDELLHFLVNESLCLQHAN